MSRPLTPSAKPLLAPIPARANPGSYETDGRRHSTPVEDAWDAFCRRLAMPTPTVHAEPGFSPLGEGLEVRHG